MPEPHDLVAQAHFGPSGSTSLTPIVIPNADHWRIAEDREFYLHGLRLAAGEFISTTT
jgi:hypothetical protein